jgi:hypothetical protein
MPKEARADGVLTFLVNDYGRPFASAPAFGNKFADWCTAASLKPVLCDDGRTRNYRAHGLRKAALRTLAHAGCTGVELMSVSGHSSLDQVQEYLDEVDQERAAELQYFLRRESIAHIFLGRSRDVMCFVDHQDRTTLKKAALSARKITRARSVRGMDRGLPVFVTGMCRTPVSKFTCFHCMANSSPRRIPVSMARWMPCNSDVLRTVAQAALSPASSPGSSLRSRPFGALGWVRA